MKKIKVLIVLAVFPAMMQAQQAVNYNDVAVIVNDNSQASIDIGNYFQQKRNIPNQNIIHIWTTTDEEIDSLIFETIRAQISNYLTSHNLADSINYIVTTKGVPLKIRKGNCDNTGFWKCSSFDTEISLILGSLDSTILQNVSIMNPYYNAVAHFRRGDYGIYLVTRLDGYKKDDVINLIDRSAPNTPVNKLSDKMIFDLSHVDTISLLQLSFLLQSVNDSMATAGWNTVFDPDTQLVTNQQNVFGYYSVNFKPANAVLNNTWVKGSFADLAACWTASTFDSATNTLNDLKVADLIAEGVTGAHGYVYCVYLSLALNGNKLFKAYTDTAAKYNLAESYYMSIKMLSSSSVVIGDPKTSIKIDNTSSTGYTDLADWVKIYPNPGNGNFVIDAGNIQINSIKIFNYTGQLIYLEKGNKKNEKMVIDFSDQPDGIYIINLETDQGLINTKVMISK